MDRQMNREYAMSVELPLNPIARHRKVEEMLADSAIIGSDVQVSIEDMTITGDIFGSNMTIYPARSLRPFKRILGRSTLKEVAKITEYVDMRAQDRAEGTI